MQLCKVCSPSLLSITSRQQQANDTSCSSYAQTMTLFMMIQAQPATTGASEAVVSCMRSEDSLVCIALP
ncbi:unnamed protein product [Protopolystoma xenopodis]|uniref:Uncharacterized protein n=1 Tax=Protopolystoma xenopodis TaxID=117903 RepID=A0A448X196_9PLAT|nr:unnamed protein product [Protopolystoma xenopodis]